MTKFPVYFPDSKFLQKKQWHQALWLLSFFYSACSLYSVVTIFLILMDRIHLISIRGVEVILTLPMIIPLYPLLVFSGGSISASGGATQTSIVENYTGLVLYAAYFAFSVVLPSIIYRIFLNAIYGKKWQK